MVRYLKEGESFDEVIKTGDFLVDFYADWCGPCKMIAPILETIESVDILKIDVDVHQEVSNKLGIMSIPTLVYYKNGNIEKKEIGFRNKEEIEEMIK